MNPSELKARVEDFFEASGADSLLLRNFPHFQDSNFQYLAGFQKPDFFAAFRKGKKPLIFSSILESGNVPANDFFQTASFSTSKELVSLLRKSLGRKVALNFEAYPVKNFQSLQKLLKGRKFIDASEALGKLRSLKSEQEISKIREACKLSEMACDYFENFFKPGITEFEVSEKLKSFFKRMDCELSFEPIVAFGKNSCIPHHECSKTRIDGNGALLLDLGAKFQGYCADISRTYFVGKPSLDVQESYHAIFEAKKLAESLIAPKAKASKAAKAVDDFLQKRLHSKLPHSLGHGIGLQEHDFPSGLNSFAKWNFEPSQCLAIEPAFYGKDYGIRLEDDCVVTAQGAKMLSAAPRELIVVK